nr:unnamed protein product [Callosobruchus analis]
MDSSNKCGTSTAISAKNPFNCEFCGIVLYKGCPQLCPTKVKVIELIKRVMIFACEDCRQEVKKYRNNPIVCIIREKPYNRWRRRIHGDDICQKKKHRTGRMGIGEYASLIVQIELTKRVGTKYHAYTPESSVDRNSVDRIENFLYEYPECHFICATEYWKSKEELMQIGTSDFNLTSYFVVNMENMEGQLSFVS